MSNKKKLKTDPLIEDIEFLKDVMTADANSNQTPKLFITRGFAKYLDEIGYDTYSNYYVITKKWDEIGKSSK